MKSVAVSFAAAIAMAIVPLQANAQSGGQVIGYGSLSNGVDPLAQAVDEVLKKDSSSWWGKYVPDTVHDTQITYRSSDGRQVHVSARYQYKAGKRLKDDSVVVKFINGQPNCVDYASMDEGCKKVGNWDSATKDAALIGAFFGALVIAGSASSNNGSSSNGQSSQTPPRDCEPQLFVDSQGRERAYYPCGH